MRPHPPFNLPHAVKPGEKALKFNRIRGVLPEVINEGTHLAIPWLEWPIIFDVRTRPRAIKSVTGTRGECPTPPQRHIRTAPMRARR